MGRWIRFSGWHPNFRQPQLFKKGKMSYDLLPVHEGFISHSDKEIGGDSNKGISEPGIRAYSLLLNKNFNPEVKGSRTNGSSTVMSGIETPLQENGKGYASTIQQFRGLEPLKKGEGIPKI